MSVTGATIIAAGAVACTSNFFVGRWLASMTPEKAAEIWGRNGRPVNVKEVHLLGRIAMFATPVLFAGFAYVGLSGMAG